MLVALHFLWSLSELYAQLFVLPGSIVSGFIVPSSSAGSSWGERTWPLAGVLEPHGSGRGDIQLYMCLFEAHWQKGVGDPWYIQEDNGQGPALDCSSLGQKPHCGRFWWASRGTQPSLSEVTNVTSTTACPHYSRILYLRIHLVTKRCLWPLSNPRDAFAVICGQEQSSEKCLPMSQFPAQAEQAGFHLPASVSLWKRPSHGLPCAPPFAVFVCVPFFFFGDFTVWKGPPRAEVWPVVTRPQFRQFSVNVLAP